MSRLKGGYLRKVEFKSHMIPFHATVTISRYRINGTPVVFPDGLFKHLLLVSHTHVPIYLSERSRMHESLPLFADSPFRAKYSLSLVVFYFSCSFYNPYFKAVLMMITIEQVLESYLAYMIKLVEEIYLRK